MGILLPICAMLLAPCLPGLLLAGEAGLATVRFATSGRTGSDWPLYEGFTKLTTFHEHLGPIQFVASFAHEDYLKSNRAEAVYGLFYCRRGAEAVRTKLAATSVQPSAVSKNVKLRAKS